MDNTNLEPTSGMSPLEEKENPRELVTIPKTINYDETNNLSMRNIWLKEKMGFWQNLFSDKKCKYCCIKKNECKCKRKSNKCSILSDIELKSASTQTGVQCRNNVPTGHRGYGVHLHFCIEPKIKKDHLKSNSILPCSNVGLNTNTGANTPRHCSKCIPSVLISNQEPEPLAKESMDHLVMAETRMPNTYQPKQEYCTYNSVQEKDKSIFMKLNTENIVLHSKNGNVPNKTDKNEMLKESWFEDNYQNIKESSDKNESKIDERHGENNNSSMLEKLPQQKLKQSDDVNNIKTSILRKPTIDLGHKENVFFPMIIPNVTNSLKGTLDECSEKKERNYVQQHNVKGQDKENKKNRNKASSTARSTCVRNSLISLRREKKQQIFEDKISIILMKLTSIEDKILELEKENICGTNEDITISCNSNKSTVSIEFGKQDQPSGTEQLSEIPAVTLNPQKERVSNTIKVKSKGENIYINSNRNVSVKKQFKRKPITVNTNHVVCFNPYELDAHSLASNSYLNSRTSKSKNPQVVIQCSTKNKKQFCDKWRRISEELKISDPDITNKLN